MVITYTIRLPAKIIVSTDVQIAFKGNNDHSKMKNLDYESSDHTEFASIEELKKYASKTELGQGIPNEDIENILWGN